MHVHPALARLRREEAPQPRVDAALARWRASGDVAAVLEALAAYGAGESLGRLPALARLTAEVEAAQAFARRFVAALTPALRAEPLAQLPLGHSASPGIARVLLAESGRAALRLAAVARRAETPAASVLFEDCEAQEIVIAGEARAALYRLAAGRIACEMRDCRPGTRIARAGPQEARQILAVAQPLLVLQLTRTASAPAPSCEYALPQGTPIKTISASKRESQQMMALGVLGALGHRPALEAMEPLALDPAAARDLRWEALRQTLAMDTRRGMALLERLAASVSDRLAEPAARLHRDLIAAHPGLAAREPA